jgi:hypothetical protein
LFLITNMAGFKSAKVFYIKELRLLEAATGSIIGVHMAALKWNKQPKQINFCAQEKLILAEDSFDKRERSWYTEGCSKRFCIDLCPCLYS